MNKLDVTLVMEKSWSIFKKNWLRLSCLSLLTIAGALIVEFFNPYSAPTNLPPKELIMWYLENGESDWVWTMLTSLVTIGLSVLLVKETVEVTMGKHITLTGSIFLRFLIVSVIVSLVEDVAFCCCIIPFFIVAPRLILADIYILDNPNMSVGEALERSWKTTKGNVMKLIVLGIIAVVILMLGVCCCLLGVIPAMALVSVMAVVVYQFLNEQMEGADGVEAKQDEVSFVVEEQTVVRD